MELTALKNKIKEAFKGEVTELELLLESVDEDDAVYPFNGYEHLISTLIEDGNLTYQDYIEIRDLYISENPYLYLFEVSAPRTFGEKIAETLVLNKGNNIKKASKTLDKDYKGQYDLYLDGIRIEVKASRVVNRDSNAPLYMKALSFGTKEAFLMNFQQLKPQCCDIFIWIAVYRDQISFWIMTSEDVKRHKDYSIGQHRGNKGNEGQLHISESNIKTLDKYLLSNDDIEDRIREAYKRLIK